MGAGLAQVTQIRSLNDIMAPACQPAVESSFTLQSPTTQAARILASSLSRMMQGDTLQVPRARRGVQPAHPTRGATESSQGGAALSCSSTWEKARRGLCMLVCAAEQRPALPPSGRGGHREASRARRLGGCQVPGRPSSRNPLGRRVRDPLLAAIPIPPAMHSP